MLYMLKVYTLIAAIVFGATGTCLLTVIAWNAAQDTHGRFEPCSALRPASVVNRSRIREQYREVAK